MPLDDSSSFPLVSSSPSFIPLLDDTGTFPALGDSGYSCSKHSHVDFCVHIHRFSFLV